MKKRTPKKSEVRASGIPVHCKFDKIVAASSLKLYEGNYNKHPAKQLDRMYKVIAGNGKKPGNGWRRCVVISKLSGMVTKGNGTVQMAARQGLDVPVEFQNYRNRSEEIRDLVADNKLSALAEEDTDALKKLLGELDASDIELTAVTTEDFEKLLAETDASDGEFPITSKLNEHYDYVLVFTENETDFVFLQTLFGVRPEKSYKKSGFGLGRAIAFKRCLQSLYENRHSINVQGGHDDHPQTPSARDRVRPAKPARRIPASRRK